MHVFLNVAYLHWCHSYSWITFAVNNMNIAKATVDVKAVFMLCCFYFVSLYTDAF